MKTTRAIRIKQLILPFFIFVLISSVCGLTALRVHEARQKSEAEWFADHMDNVARLIEKQASEVLRALENIGAVASLSEKRVEKSDTRDFHDFVEWTGLLEHYPQMEAVALVQMIDAEHADEQIARLNADPARPALGYGPLKIYPQSPNKQKAPVIAAMPLNKVRKAVGFDMFSHPVRRHTAERARDTASTQLSQRIILLTGEPGVVLAHPIYAGGRQPGFLEARREHFQGFTMAAYATSSFLSGFLHRIEGLGLHVDIHSVGAAIDSPVSEHSIGLDTILSSSSLSDRPFTLWSEEQLIAPLSSGANVRDIIVGGQRWRIVGRHATLHAGVFPDDTIFLILGFGFVFAGLTAAIVFMKVRSADELTRRVVERTQALDRSRQQLIASQAQYFELAAVAEKVNDGMVTLDLEGHILWCNASFEAATQYKLAELKGRRCEEVIYGPETNLEASAKIRRAVQDRQPIRVEIVNYNKSGEPIWVDLGISVMRDENGKPWRFSAIWRDISEQKRRALFLETVLQNIDSGVALMDSDLRINLFNERLCELFGLPIDFLQSKPTMREVMNSLRHHKIYNVNGSSDDDWFHYVEKRISEVQKGDCSPYEMFLGDGRVLLFSCVAVGSGRMTSYVDITQIKEQQKALEETADALRRANKTVERQATIDELTGIANRRSLTNYLESQVNRAGESVAVLHIDLDRFKHINDTLGHAAGDFVLRHTAELLQNVLGENAFVARMGGDEFVAVVPYHGDVTIVEAKASAIVTHCSRPIRFNGRECRFGASVGLALSGPDQSAQDLLINSDLALYRAKNDGRGQSKTFTKAFEAEVSAVKELADDLLRGLENDEFEPYFQPQYFSEDAALAGVEALARWNHPTRGVLAPNDFLPVAEELKIVADIDQAILNKAIELCVEAEDQGILIPKMSVNVSARRLADPDLKNRLLNLPKIHCALSFELLESIFFDDDHEPFKLNIDLLRELGIGVEIDDFGSGRASIVGLMKVAPDRMKIDRQLISPIDTDPAQRLLVKSIVTIGHSLKIGVTAEGVENKKQANILRTLGCDVLQGYYFSHPLPKQDFLDLVGNTSTNVLRKHMSGSEA